LERVFGLVRKRELERSYTCNIYNLVIHYRNITEGCLAVGYTALKPALKALISLDNVRLEVIAIICKESYSSTECTLALTAHTRDYKEVKYHRRERWIEMLASFTPPP
jgi:hypothetical protein